MNRTGKAVATIGHGLIILGVFLLFVVVALAANEQYQVSAASGASEVTVTLRPTVAPVEIAAPEIAPPPRTPPALPVGIASPNATPSRIPDAVVDVERQLNNAVPAPVAEQTLSTITRIVIPAINVDRKVVEMGWTVQVLDGQEVAVWDVDKYRVGHHTGTSNPGQGGNIVLSGHSGGWQYPFNDIFYLKSGDALQLTSDGTVYDYTVSEHILVDEVGQPLEKRIENAQYIESTDEEVVTMVACWPLTGPDKFKQRIIIRATPGRNPTSTTEAP